MHSYTKLLILPPKEQGGGSFPKFSSHSEMSLSGFNRTEQEACRENPDERRPQTTRKTKYERRKIYHIPLSKISNTIFAKITQFQRVG